MMISLGFLAAARYLYYFSYLCQNVKTHQTHHLPTLCLSVRVSNELGKGDPKAAKFSIVNIVVTSLVIGLVLFVFFLFFRGRLAYIFTTESDVAAEVANLSPLLAFSILLNSIQPVLSGINHFKSYLYSQSYKLQRISTESFRMNRRGCWGGMAEHRCIRESWMLLPDRNSFRSFARLCHQSTSGGNEVSIIHSYTIMCIVEFLIYQNLYTQGVWIGMLIGTFIQTIILLIITKRTDWDKQVLLIPSRFSFKNSIFRKRDPRSRICRWPLHGKE